MSEYGDTDVLQFLDHAAERGMMPSTTANSLKVASGKLFEILTDSERLDVRRLDLDELAKRFQNKRARDYSPSSLKEYGRRTKRAVDLFLQWKSSPADFKVATRSTVVSRRAPHPRQPTEIGTETETHVAPPLSRSASNSTASAFDTALPLRAGVVVGIQNVPVDLTAAEAERLAQFVRLLVSGGD